MLVRHAGTLLDGVEAAEAELAGLAAGHLAGVVRVVRLSVRVPTHRRAGGGAARGDPPDIRVEATEREVEEAVPALRLHHLDPVVGDEYEGQPRPVHADLKRGRSARGGPLVLAADAPARAAPPGPDGAARGRGVGRVPAGTGHREMQVRACRRLGGFEPDLRYASDDFLILLELVRTTGTLALLPDLVLGLGAPGVAVRSSPKARSAARSSCSRARPAPRGRPTVSRRRCAERRPP